MTSLSRWELSLCCIAFSLTPCRAETWPTLEQYVESCALIVKCKTEVGVGYRVLETWKGTYGPDLFAHRPPANYILTNNCHGNEEVADGREIVFFFTPKDHSTKLDAHSTAFHIKDGRVVYGSTSDWLRKEYTVEEFRQAIRSIVRRQLLDARTVTTAVAGGLAVAAGLPEIPEKGASTHIPPRMMSDPELPSSTIHRATVIHLIWPGIAICGLLAILIVLYCYCKWRIRPSSVTKM